MGFGDAGHRANHLIGQQEPKLLDRVRPAIPARRYSRRTEDAYVAWIKENGCDVRTVQELLRHQDVTTTMIYTHALNRGGKGVRSPVDVL